MGNSNDRFENIFVLCTGRCGSTTFQKACSHIKNYTVSHERNMSNINDRFRYPKYHIEIDNRLVWFLGSLDKIYGKKPFYVHLFRNKTETAKSFAPRRGPRNILLNFARGICFQKEYKNLPMAMKLVETVWDNIELFLRDKPNKIAIDIDNPEREFRQFWTKINAKGNFEKAREEFNWKYNVGVTK